MTRRARRLVRARGDVMRGDVMRIAMRSGMPESRIFL
jgi:hypothetical protein